MRRDKSAHVRVHAAAGSRYIRMDGSAAQAVSPAKTERIAAALYLSLHNDASTRRWRTAKTLNRSLRHSRLVGTRPRLVAKPNSLTQEVTRKNRRGRGVGIIAGTCIRPRPSRRSPLPRLKQETAPHQSRAPKMEVPLPWEKRSTSVSTAEALPEVQHVAFSLPPRQTHRTRSRTSRDPCARMLNSAAAQLVESIAAGIVVTPACTAHELVRLQERRVSERQHQRTKILETSLANEKHSLTPELKSKFRSLSLLRSSLAASNATAVECDDAPAPALSNAPAWWQWVGYVPSLNATTVAAANTAPVLRAVHVAAAATTGAAAAAADAKCASSYSGTTSRLAVDALAEFAGSAPWIVSPFRSLHVLEGEGDDARTTSLTMPVR